MKRSFWWLPCLINLCLLLPIETLAAETAPAQAVADAWLAQVDAGAYRESWQDTAALFRQTVSADAWVAALQSVRAPLGAVQTRALRSAAPTRILPNAPTGEYVVFRFATDFAQRDKAIETVTTRLEADGIWRVAGYYIR